MQSLAKTFALNAWRRGPDGSESDGRYSGLAALDRAGGAGPGFTHWGWRVPILEGTKDVRAGEIFTFRDIVGRSVLAAGFALSPDVVPRKLREQTESYKSDIRSSEAPCGA